MYDILGRKSKIRVKNISFKFFPAVFDHKCNMICSEDGELVPVETLIKFRFQSVLQQFQFTEWNKNYISPYINKYLDPNMIGSCNLKNGIRIGIPEYYQQLSDEGIKKSVQVT